MISPGRAVRHPWVYETPDECHKNLWRKFPREVKYMSDCLELVWQLRRVSDSYIGARFPTRTGQIQGAPRQLASENVKTDVDTQYIGPFPRAHLGMSEEELPREAILNVVWSKDEREEWRITQIKGHPED